MRQDKFIRFAHWTPPPGTSKRFATWFFAAEADTDEMVNVDGGEILNHRWIKPVDALQKHASGDIDLVPPTWITLYHLTLYATTSAILEHFRQNPGKVYETRVVKRDDGVRVALWRGDAGYEAWDADIDGDRHRLVLAKDGFQFENTVEEY